MIANRALSRANAMAKAIVDCGHELSSPWVLGDLGGQASGPVNVFLRDKTGSEESEVLVADVTSPSTGVGMEIMAAHIAGRRIILVTRKGNPVSRMLLHMDSKELIEYEEEDEVYSKLCAALGPSSSQR